MNQTVLASLRLVAVSLTACEKPTVVNVPTPVVTPVVPGPAGAQGPSGTPGPSGTQGPTGRPGDGATVIVVPPAASAPN